MKAKTARDRKRRELLKVYDEKRRKLKALVLSSSDPKEIERSLKLLRKLPRNSSSTRVKNRCIETGRSRSPHRILRLSRLELRRRGNRGMIPGLRRSSF